MNWREQLSDLLSDPFRQGGLSDRFVKWVLAPIVFGLTAVVFARIVWVWLAWPGH